MHSQATDFQRGNDRAPNHYRTRGDTSERRGRHVPAIETSEGRAAYDAIVARKAAQRGRRRTIALAIVGLLLSGAVALVVLSKGGLAFVGLFCVFVSIFTLAVGFAKVNWTERDYYSVPGSRDANGEHHCIHCGHPGIHRHGVYKSNQKFADCSKCKATLWSFTE